MTRPILNKDHTSLKKRTIQKLLITEYSLSNKDYLPYLLTLAPNDLLPDYTFMYVFKRFVKDKLMYRYTFVYSSDWLDDTSLYLLDVTPTSLVSFYNRFSLP